MQKGLNTPSLLYPIVYKCHNFWRILGNRKKVHVATSYTYTLLNFSFVWVMCAEHLRNGHPCIRFPRNRGNDAVGQSFFSRFHLCHLLFALSVICELLQLRGERGIGTLSSIYFIFLNFNRHFTCASELI